MHRIEHLLRRTVGLDAASIADITGLTPANIGMKIHRIKNILAHRIRKEQSHA